MYQHYEVLITFLGSPHLPQESIHGPWDLRKKIIRLSFKLEFQEPVNFIHVLL